MYVFPDLSDRGYPVPGYSTVLPMFERVEYALPGEKEGW
jgi:conjugative transfer region lipoprotein (TIGR03751 family)